MDFMGFHIVDIVIVSLVLFLAIKGLVNGFAKELLNFLIVVGGVALAARFNLKVVELINAQNIVPNISENYAKIVGFIAIILTIWILLGLISSIITRLTSDTTGVVSRILGYILSFARYVFIFSLIVFGVNQSDFFANEAEKLKTDTQLFVPMTKIGATLLNIDLNTTTSAISEAEESIDANITTTTAVPETNSTVEESTTPVENNTSN